ncbi:integrase [Sporomusaceae bacterium BoRhaA]|uniref:tyrosine-type recombinase/integrase n=1 Tax=Pelorhabdus rhamnosifermentans TaxID=2772457 RepID=UPI001C05EE8F|nr:tyrosine-type recombinase/integrase [Pelorhabdus rhamnosifermentans]MBU2700446.1 integrase [Pelorhabdus rhamnosifermentans]
MAKKLDKGFDYNLKWGANSAFRYRKMIKGKQFEVYGSNPDVCKDKMEREIADFKEGFKKDNPTLGEWMREYLRHYIEIEMKTKAKTKNTNMEKFESTLANYETTARTGVINREIGNIRIKDLSEKDLYLHFHQLFIEKPASAKNALWLCKKALHRAMKNRLIRDNPCEDIKLPKLDIIKKAKQPTKDLIKIIKEILKRFDRNDDDLSLYYHLGFRLGMRKGEILGLASSCIFLDKKQIEICQQLTKTNPLAFDLNGNKIEERSDKYKTSILKETKTEGSNRIIPIPNCLLEKIQKKIQKSSIIENKVAESCILAKSKDFTPKCDLLFIKADGKPYFSNTPTKKLKKMLEEIQNDEKFEMSEEDKSLILTSHDMRKLANSILAGEDINKSKLEALLGHSPRSEDTNAAHYTAFTSESLINLVELLSEIIDKEE